MDNTNKAVGIVGAGPVGLACALRLSSFGIPTVLFDAKPHLVKQGSKACLIQGDVLEILENFGCGEKVAEEGVPWRIGHTYIRGKEIDRMEYPSRVGFSQFVNISQFRIEQILLEALEQSPLCTIKWGHEVVGLEQEGSGIELLLKTAGNTEKMYFRYLIGCDGIRSKMREMIGVEWTGYTHKDRFLITDIYTKLAISKERHFHFDPPFNPGRQLVMHPQPNDMWRIDWQLPPDADIEKERKTGALDQRIRAVIGNIPYKLDWLSTYRFNQRVVDRFRVGNVFLAGDAAHALPPYGSRGMNSGIQDADNLAWKLALVIDEGADETLLDTYHSERYAAAKENLRISEATIRFMVPPTPAKKAWRNFLLAASSVFPIFRKSLNSGKMAEPFRYTNSEIIEGGSATSIVGEFAPDIAVALGEGRKTRLRWTCRGKFSFVYFCKSEADLETLIKKLPPASANKQFQTIVVLPISEFPNKLPASITPVFVDDLPGSIGAYCQGNANWYLVRPDGHIASCGNFHHGFSPGRVFEKCSKTRVASKFQFDARPVKPQRRTINSPTCLPAEL